eukprot:2924646-Amphidinium_carterae.1
MRSRSLSEQWMEVSLGHNIWAWSAVEHPNSHNDHTPRQGYQQQGARPRTPSEGRLAAHCRAVPEWQG